MRLNRPTPPRRTAPSGLVSEWHMFIKHKKWLIVLALGAFLLGVYEQSQIGWTSEAAASFSLSGDIGSFFTANLLNLLLWLYVLVKLLCKCSGISQPAVAWAIFKGCATYFGWLVLVIWAVVKLITISIPDIINPTHFLDRLKMLPQPALWLMFALLLVLFAYLQSVATITMVGSILRRHFNTAAPRLPTIVAWHLPVSALFLSLRMPLIWLSLLAILLFKLFSGWLSVLGLPFIHLITEPLAQLALLFTVHLTYSLCVDPHQEAAYQRFNKTRLNAAPVQPKRV